MVLPRPAAFRALLRPQAVRATRTGARAQQWQRVSRRGYAGAPAQKASSTSDLPWAIGAVVVTVPAVGWLLKPGNKEHGHDSHEKHEKHEEEKPAEPEPEPAEEEPKPEESGSDSEESQKQDTPDSSDAESSDGKDETSGPTQAGNKEKEVSDAKDGVKVRKESESGKAQGVGDSISEEEGTVKDKATPSKPPVKGETSEKQAGLSNTDTKHSTDVGEDPTKSKKAPGVPETAKHQGTVGSD